MRDYSAFEGPSEEEIALAHRAYRARRIGESAAMSGQQSVGSWKGTPRKAKYDQSFEGVRIR